MRRVRILVEGQTEEAFVKELLIARYAAMGLYLYPITVTTSRGHKGGVVRYAQVRRQIELLCKQDAGSHVSTLFDLYALPDDFPGKRDPEWPAHGSGHQKASFIEEALMRDIGSANFIPNIMVHEFEALLFVQPEQFAQWADKWVVKKLVAARKDSKPEDINDGPLTAPSKRILDAMPEYQKPWHGPLIACDIGLDVMRRECPHFDGWLRNLEALIP